jgi:hypothetical protein
MQLNVRFNNKKAYNKFRRNYKKGKGVNIKPSDIEVIDGEGFLDGLKKVANSQITKGIVKSVVAPAVTKVIASTGGKFAGDVSQAAFNSYTGSGLMDIVKSKTAKNLTKVLAPVIANQVQKATGSNLAGNLTGVALNAYTGSGARASKINNNNGVSLPSTVLVSPQNANIDLAQTMQARMAHVRSFQKRVKGSSVNPLGSR